MPGFHSSLYREWPRYSLTVNLPTAENWTHRGRRGPQGRGAALCGTESLGELYAARTERHSEPWCGGVPNLLVYATKISSQYNYCNGKDYSSRKSVLLGIPCICVITVFFVGKHAFETKNLTQMATTETNCKKQIAHAAKHMIDGRKSQLWPQRWGKKTRERTLVGKLPTHCMLSGACLAHFRGVKITKFLTLFYHSVAYFILHPAYLLQAK